jgi:hypothetical protein
MKHAVILAALILTVTQADAAPIVDEVLAAHGGASAIAKTANIRQTGVVMSPARGTEGRLERTFSWPDRLRVSVQYPGDTELRILDGARGARDGAQVEGPPLVAMVLQAGRSNLPYLLLQRRDRVQELPRITRDGREYLALSIPFTDAIEIRIDVDPESHYIVRSEASLPGSGYTFATAYADFREVGGVFFAFREQNFAGGRLTGDTRIERLEIAPEVDASTFSIEPVHRVPDGHPSVPPGHPVPPNHPQTKKPRSGTSV